jgi:MFS family permease
MVSKIVAVFCFLSFTLSIDYSLSLISAQAYWIATGGNPTLTGLLFGIYDGPTIIVTPLLAIFLGKRKITYKTVFIVGLIINLLGNICYALADIAGSWLMVILGRGIAGIGASVLPLIMTYVAENLDTDEQQTAVGYIKYISAISRIVGPALGSLISVTYHANGTIGRIFNLFTLVGWIPAVFAFICIVLLCCFFQEEEPEEQDDTKMPVGTIISNFWSIFLIGFASTFIYWFYMGNAFMITTHYYHLIDDEHDLYRIYITGFIGFIVAFICFLFLKEKLAGQKGLWVSILIQSVSTYLFLPNPKPFFYIAVGLTTFAYGLMIPSLNVLNNVLARKIKTYLGSSMAFAVSLLIVVQSFARFTGPPCFDLFTAPINAMNCSFKDPDKYIVSGCDIEGYIGSGAVFTTIALFMMLTGAFFFKRRIDRIEAGILNN